MKYQPLYENLLDLMREAGNIMLSAHNVDTDENVTAKPGSANFVCSCQRRGGRGCHNRRRVLIRRICGAGEESTVFLVRGVPTASVVNIYYNQKCY